MDSVTRRVRLSAILSLMMFFSTPAFSQLLTGSITGRAQDRSGALIPGVEVSISSPAMIGGARTAVTDELGSYRFALLPPGTYRVTFALRGFKTLNVEGVTVTVGATMTINGTLEVAALAEEVTVTSEVPTIDLEAAAVGVNWSKQKIEKIPFGRSMQALIALIPGLYTTSYDVGGNTRGGSTTSGARTYGRSGGDMQTYDGVLWSGVFQEYTQYGEVQISTAAKGSESSSPGVATDLVIKSGGNDFHGSALAAWQGGRTQSNNVTQKLLDRGFSATGNKFTRYNDFIGDFGGPVLRDKFWFYAGFGYTYTGQFIPGFISEETGEPVAFYTRLRNPTVKLTYQLTHDMKLESTSHFSNKWQPYRTGDQFTPLEATQAQDYSAGIGPTLKWTYIVNPRMTADVGIHPSGYHWPDYAWSEEPRRMDLTTTHKRGSIQLIDRKVSRWQWNANWSWVADIGGKNHEIKSGFLHLWDKLFNETIGYPNHQVYRYRSQAGDTNYFLRPDSVQVFDTPNSSGNVEVYDAWFITDKITWNRKLTLNAGIRFDRYSSYLPEQGNPGTGPYATKKVFPEQHDFPAYPTWSPRLSVIYDMTGEGKVALKASYGRYTGGTALTSTISPTPFAGSVNPAATTTSTYSNWDGRIPYTPRPQDLVSVSGGAGDRRIDPDSKAPYMEEYTTGIELGFSRDHTFRFNVIRKLDYQKNKTVNVGLPFSAYTDVRYAVDPGRDNLVGTADDGIMQAWSVPRSHPNFGSNNILLTNARNNEGVSLYTGFDAVFNKQYSNGWSLLAGYTATFGKPRNVDPETPNELVYNWQLPEWHYTVKMNGQYDLPWGLMYSATYQVQSGEYYGRQAQMRNALNSLVTITVEGQVGRYDWVKLLDNRISKTFRINDQHSIEGMVDIFNVLNSSAILTHETLNGPNYLKVLSRGAGAEVALPIVPARIVRFGARWRF